MAFKWHVPAGQPLVHHFIMHGLLLCEARLLVAVLSRLASHAGPKVFVTYEVIQEDIDVSRCMTPGLHDSVTQLSHDSVVNVSV